MLTREQEILDAARRLFHEKGYFATTMQDIAEAVGLQKASLYHYIRSKEELLLRIQGETMRLFHAQLDRIEASGANYRQKLAEVLRAHLRIVTAHQATLAVLFQEERALPPEYAQKVRAETRRYTQRLTRLIAQGVAAGEFRPLDPAATCLALLGALNWAYRWYSPQGRLSVDQLADQWTQLVLNGLAAVPTQDTPEAQGRDGLSAPSGPPATPEAAAPGPAVAAAAKPPGSRAAGTGRLAPPATAAGRQPGCSADGNVVGHGRRDR